MNRVDQYLNAGKLSEQEKDEARLFLFASNMIKPEPERRSPDSTDRSDPGHVPRLGFQQ
jgi:hypothetical protein